MSIVDIAVIAGAIVVAFMILRFIGKLLARVVSIIFVAGFVIFVLFYWRGGVLDLGNKDFMLTELQEKYCDEAQYDEIKCNCIIEPLVQDIFSEYSTDEVIEFKENKLKSLKVILKSLSANNKQIMECLRENDALEKWDEFIYELEDTDIDQKFKRKWKELKEKH